MWLAFITFTMWMNAFSYHFSSEPYRQPFFFCVYIFATWNSSSFHLSEVFLFAFVWFDVILFARRWVIHQKNGPNNHNQHIMDLKRKHTIKLKPFFAPFDEWNKRKMNIISIDNDTVLWCLSKTESGQFPSRICLNKFQTMRVGWIMI